MTDLCGVRDWQTGADCLLNADHTQRGTQHRGYAYLGGRHAVHWGQGRRTAPFPQPTTNGDTE